KLNAMEKGFFIASIAAVSLVGLVSVRQAPTQKVKHPVGPTSVTKSTNAAAVTNIAAADTVPANVEFKSLNSVTNKDDKGATKTINAVDKNGRKYKVVMKDDDSLEFYIDDKKISPGEMDNYKTLIDDIEQAVELGEKKNLEKMKKAKEEQSGQ